MDMAYQEILSEEELQEITGRARHHDQIAWLDENRWRYVVSKRERPIVGRLYARMKLGGVDLRQYSAPTGGEFRLIEPDFSKVT